MRITGPGRRRIQYIPPESKRRVRGIRITDDGAPPAPDPTITVTHRANLVNTGATSYTLSSVAIGTANANRVVVVGISSRANIDSIVVTINGGATTLAGKSPRGIYNGGVWYATVASGTTCDVAASTIGDTNTVAFTVWTLDAESAISLAAFHAVDTTGVVYDAGDPANSYFEFSLNMGAGDAALYVMMHGNTNSASPAPTWTSATGVLSESSASARSAFAAHYVAATAETPHTDRATLNSTYGAPSRTNFAAVFTAS